MRINAEERPKDGDWHVLVSEGLEAETRESRNQPRILRRSGQHGRRDARASGFRVESGLGEPDACG